MRILQVLIVVSVVIFGFGRFLQGDDVLVGDEFLDAEIVTVGMDHISGAPVVLLREERDGRTVPIWIGFAEAQAIMQALHEIETPRPMTHELAVNLLASMDAEIDELVVRDMRNGIFYATLYLRVEGREERIEVDCRPSDGLALAARTGARIRVAEKILGETPDIDFVPPPDVDQVVQVLGLTVVTPTAALREEFGISEREGLIISGVQTAASGKGFHRGDLIIQVNKVVPATPMEFLDEVMETERGREAEVRIWRDGEEKVIQLPTTEEPRRRTAPI